VRAERLTEKAAAVGFDWPDLQGVLAKVREEIGELEEAIARRAAAAPHDGEAHDLHGRVEHELGDVLFALANLGRFLKVHPEEALRGSVRRFESRFHHIEERLREQGRTPREATLQEMDRYWDEAKKREKSAT
jgi:ATP diphosphatase